MRGLAWYLLVMASLKVISCLHTAITTKKESEASEGFWRALMAIPTIVFFILYLK